MLLFGFGVIFIIKYYQSEYVDEADELLKEEDEASVLEAEQMLNLVEILNYIMAVAIILFNKIFVGSLIDKIVEYENFKFLFKSFMFPRSEKISTQTRVNISFAHKLSLVIIRFLFKYYIFKF